MRYTIIGADRDTGEDVDLTLEAADEEAARDSAARKGILVASVTRRRDLAHRESAQEFKPRLEQGHIAGAPVLNVAMPRRSNSTAIACFILGIMAILFCWIPILGLLTVPLAALGLLLALIALIVALTRRGAGLGFTITGAALCCGAMLVSVSMFKAVDRAVNELSGIGPTQRVAKADAVAEWLPAGQAVQIGDARVSIRSVAIRDPAMEGGSVYGEKLLLVAVSIENRSQTLKMDYLGWDADAIMRRDENVSLKDNFGNQYSYRDLSSYGLRRVAGDITYADIYPGQSATDLLAFELPVAGIEHLDLRLPANNVGGERTDQIRWRIPASMIQR